MKVVNKQICDCKIPVLTEKLNLLSHKTFEKSKEKSSSIVSNMTDKEIDTVQKIEKVQVDTSGKSFDWCSGCNDLDAKYNDLKANNNDLDAKYSDLTARSNDLTARNNDLAAKFESSKEYPRIILALQDLNGYMRLEQISSRSTSFKKVKELHSHPIVCAHYYCHYIPEEDKESTKFTKL